jgi:hypothetical protein
MVAWRNLVKSLERANTRGITEWTSLFSKYKEKIKFHFIIHKRYQRISKK